MELLPKDVINLILNYLDNTDFFNCIISAKLFNVHNLNNQTYKLYLERKVCPVTIYLDSDHRFDDVDNSYLKLPHNKYGFNHFEGILKSNNDLYYKNKFVCNLNEYREKFLCSSGIENNDDKYNGKFHQYYTAYIISSIKNEILNSSVHYWIRPPLLFNDVSITNAHISMSIYEHDAIKIYNKIKTEEIFEDTYQSRFCDNCNNDINEKLDIYYHCTVCADYDFCENCFNSETHDHQMNKIN